MFASTQYNLITVLRETSISRRGLIHLITPRSLEDKAKRYLDAILNRVSQGLPFPRIGRQQK